MAQSGEARRRIRALKMTIEEYLDFIHSQKSLDLTVDRLNQIINLHGFRQIHKAPKKDLIEVVNNLELMDPTRSTLQDDGVSSDAFLALDDVVKDLNELKWQECCVTSVLTLNAVKHHQHESLNGGGGGGGSSVGTTVSVAKEKPLKKRRRKLGNLALVDGGGGGVQKEPVPPTAGSEAPSGSLALVTWIPHKKRGWRCTSPATANEVQPSCPANANDAQPSSSVV